MLGIALLSFLYPVKSKIIPVKKNGKSENVAVKKKVAAKNTKNPLISIRENWHFPVKYKKTNPPVKLKSMPLKKKIIFFPLKLKIKAKKNDFCLWKGFFLPLEKKTKNLPMEKKWPWKSSELGKKVRVKFDFKS